MSEISEIPMIEQKEAGTKPKHEFPPIPAPKKITEGDIDAAVKDVIRKAEEEQRDKTHVQTEEGLSPASNTLFESSDSTFLSRLKKFPEKARTVLKLSVETVKKGAKEAALTGTAVSFLVSSGCGNVERQSTPPPTPTSAVAELPTGMPSATAVSEYLVTPIPAEPTPVLFPVPPLETTPTNTPFPTETPTPTATMPPSSTQEVTPTPSQPPQQEQAERKELIPYSPSITIVDAAPSVATKGLIQKEFVSNEAMIRQMLGDKYMSTDQLIQEFGLDYADKWDEVVEKYPQALVYRLTDTYFKHGEKVTRVMESTLERSGLQNTGVNILPLQQIFDKDSITFIKDSSGNPGISLNFDPQRIIKLVDTHG